MRFNFLHIAFSTLFLLQQPLAAKAQSAIGSKKILEEGAIPGKASCMLFSAKGFFYFASSQGLFLFNGVTLHPLNKDDSAATNISALYESKAGRLWVGCSNGNLYQLQSNKLVAWKPLEGLSKKPVSGIAEDSSGNLWFATKGEGLYVFHQNKLYNINTDDGLSDNYVYDIKLSGNQIVAATDNGLSICSFSPQKKQIKNIAAANGLTDNIVQTIATDFKNTAVLWLGFQNGGLGRFDIGTGESKTVYTGNNAAPLNKIFPGDEELWLAGNNGLTVLSRNNYQVVVEEPVKNLSAIYADDEANIWLLSSAALYKTNGEQLRLVLQPTAEENNQVHDLFVDDNGSYWITSKAGIICYENAANKISRKYYPLSVKPGSDIICIYRDVNGFIWVGTMGDGVFIIEPSNKSVKRISHADVLKHASVLSISGNKNHVWITALEGVWKTTVSNPGATYDNYVFENLNTASTIGSTYIYYVLEDSKGRVWFATDGKGITLLENGTYKTFREKDGLEAKVIYSVLEDRNGSIWFTALNNGLYKFNGTSFKHFGTAAGLPDLNISSLVLNNNGSIFCSTQKENFLIDVNTGLVITPGATGSQGEINTDLNSTFSNGKHVFYHTDKGIYACRTASYSKAGMPQTRILNVSLFLQQLDEHATNEFAHNENNLSFNFAGFYYSNPEKIQYQYKLEGYNNNWQFTKDGFVNFPKLQSGTYVFKVRSSVTGNFFNASEAVYTFTIRKAFWKQWWFVFLSIAAATAILYYIIKAREKEVKKIQQLQTEKLQSQYETLKNQVNPHFLFNSFNTLLTIIDDNPRKASDYVEHLSDFYRSIVNLREKDIISLGDELKIIEHYFFIQKKRFGNALNFNTSITEEDKAGYSLPPLCLQLLVENAIKHNVVSKEKPLTLTASLQQNWLIVQNNINEKISAEKGEGLGLQNIKNRFLLIAEKEVIIEKTKEHFIVKLPLIKLL